MASQVREGRSIERLRRHHGAARMSRSLQALILASVLLAGCGPVKPAPPVIPQIVTQTVTKYVPVPAELSAPCHVTERASNKVKDVVDAFNGRGDDLKECSRRMSAIRSLNTSTESQP